MKCDFCGSEMEVDTVDFNFKGNKDIYWICNKCNASCIQNIRYNRIRKEYWHREDQTIIDYEKDY